MSWLLLRRPDRTLTVEFDAFADVFSGRRLDTFITRAEAIAAMARQREHDELQALREAGQKELF